MGWVGAWGVACFEGGTSLPRPACCLLLPPRPAHSACCYCQVTRHGATASGCLPATTCLLQPTLPAATAKPVCLLLPAAAAAAAAFLLLPAATACYGCPGDEQAKVVLAMNEAPLLNMARSTPT